MPFRDAFYALLRLLGFAPARQTAGVLALMLLTALTDGVGIMMLVPLIHVALPRDTPAGGPVPESWMTLLAGVPLGALLALFVMLVLARAMLLYIQQIGNSRLIHQVVDNLRVQSFDAVVHAEWRWLSQQQAAMFNSQILSNVARVGAGLQHALNLISRLASTGAFLAAALLLDWMLALAAIAGGAVLTMLVSGHRRRLVELGRALGPSNRELHAQVQEGMAGIRMTRVWQGESRTLQAFTQTVASMRKIQLDHQIMAGRGRVALQAGGALLLAVIVYVGVEGLAIQPALLLPLLLVFIRLVPALGALQGAWHNWLHSVPALLDSETLLAEARREAEPQPAGDSEGGISLERELRLSDVTVHYAARTRPSLSRFNAVFTAFTTTVITGPSGAGKSTLADVITGLIGPDSGQMLIDGRVIGSADRLRWRRSVAYVQQDSFLFNGSVRDNLLRAVPRADEHAIMAALELAAADFVHALPQGLDTLVGDNGVRLSGGERQRIALARALLRQPSLLILDEATSAVDHDNELAIQQAIARLNGAMTIVAITHRGFRDLAADQVIALTAPDPS